jgi:hypothetical protein
MDRAALDLELRPRGADARATGLRMIGGHGIPNIKLERLYSTQPIGATLRARLVIE